MFRILVPSDGSAHAERAVDLLVRSAAIYAGPVEVHLLNVQHPFPGTVHQGRAETDRAHREEGLRVLASAGERLAAAGIRCLQHVRVGEPAEVIVRFAQDERVDQIAIGTHGRGAMAALLLGSTAQRVIHLSTVPVLLVK